MDERMYHRELLKAMKRRERGEQPDYWLGYERGLIRGFRGEKFGTAKDHEFWLSLAAERDVSLRERGRGYRDGIVMATAEEAA